MNQKHSNPDRSKGRGRIWITLLIFCTLATGFMQAANKVFAQTTVTATFRDTTLSEVLWEIQRQTDFTFVYSTNDVKQIKVKNLNVSNEKIASVLDKCLKDSGLTYSVHEGVIAIKQAEEKASVAPQQKTTLTGTVLDENGEPIIGANIIVKGTTQGTTTDMDGRFTLEVDNASATLVISYIGYSKMEVKAMVGKPMKVVMNPDNNVMEEVVVTGYGTFKKSAYAGSASTVKTGELKDVPTVSFSGMLQGSAPGVQISSASGQPGAATSINIRGMGSFNASSSPLYVIDGVPVVSGDYSSLGTTSGLDIMSTISNSDIENITVIKDAAAASLYGSRAANGVILITTKKGKAGRPSISAKADWGFSDFAMEYRPVMSGEERREYIWNGLKAYSEKNGYSEAEASAYADKYIDNYAPVPWCGYVDWDDVLFKTGKHETYEVSASGGTDRVSYYTSLTYLKQDGVTADSGLERLSGRVNVDYKASNKLTLGANILFSSVNQDVYGEGTSYTSPFYSSRNCVVPSDPVYNEDGSWNRDFIRNSDRNPLLAQTYDYRRENIYRSFNTIYGEYEFIPNLKLKSTLSFDHSNGKGRRWYDPRTSNGDDVNGDMYQNWYEQNKLVWSNQLSYNTTIKEDHHLDVLVGYEIDDSYYNYMSGEKNNFATYKKDALSNGATVVDVNGYDSRSRLVSYLSRINYDYKNKYFLGASARIDGSSRLASSSRWGCFWSVSGAWRIIEEEFMKSQEDWLSDLKLRASYGVNGTLPSDYYGYYGLASLTGSYMSTPAYSLSQIANEDLSWETNHNLNIGLDFGLWNRLNVTLEYYTRTTKNLLMDYPVSMTTGFSSYLLNIGEVKNKGFELEISSTNFNTRNFKWNSTFTLAHNQNKIVTLDGIQTEIISGTQIHKVGESYRTFYLIEFAGINPETGAAQFYTNTLDENGNYIKDITEKPNEANYIPYKHAEPTLTGGLSNSLRYKWFDLNFMLSYQFGGYSYDTWAQKTEHGGNDLLANIPTYYRDSWKKPGDVTQYELFIAAPTYPMSSYSNTRRVHSTDFIRLKNITFGITLPEQWTRKCGLQSVRLYASASNLWTWARYDYYDPEAVSAGTAIWGTPPLKTVTFGINLNL